MASLMQKKSKKHWQPTKKLYIFNQFNKNFLFSFYIKQGWFKKPTKKTKQALLKKTPISGFFDILVIS